MRISPIIGWRQRVKKIEQLFNYFPGHFVFRRSLTVYICVPGFFI